MDNKNEKIFSRNRIKLPNLDKFYAKKNVRKILKIIIILKELRQQHLVKCLKIMFQFITQLLLINYMKQELV